MIALVLVSTMLIAQDATYEEGAKVFKLSCAQGYCHGSGGTQGRAPKLIGRAYDAAAARKIIESGVANTGMPPFKDRLNAAQLNAVLYYVVKISGGDTSKIDLASGGSQKQQMPAGAAQGKALFFDAFKAENRCSTCHALEDTGLAVGPNLSSGGPYPAAAIRAGKDATLRTVTAGQDRFPGMYAGEKGDFVKVYDLTVAPPVLRTFKKGFVTFGPGSTTWTHASATQAYKDAEVEAIAAYLQWIGER